MPSIGPISELVNNISASIDGLVSDLLGNSVETGVPKHPDDKEIQAVLSNLNPSNWMKLSFPYTFSVEFIGTSIGAFFDDFSLPLAPNSIRQSEVPAISIRPTQGGTTTSHSGNRYMSLSIKGTTGNHPFKGTGGAKAKDGTAIFQPKELKYKSGYEVFIRFRNWLRAYYEFKKTSGPDAYDLRLIFKNYKDGEFLIVELVKFDMERQATRSFLYDYDIEFKVLAHHTFKELASSKSFLFEDVLEDALEAIDTARGAFLRFQDIIRQVESTYESVVIESLRKISLSMKAFMGVTTVAADMGSKVISNTVSAAGSLAILTGIQAQQKENRITGTLDPRLANAVLPKDLASAAQTQGAKAILNLGEALMALDPSVFPEASRTALSKEASDSGNLPRSFYEETLSELKRVKQNTEDFLNLGSPEYDTLFDRTATLTAPPTKLATADEYALLKGFNDAIAGIRLLLSSQDLFKSTFDERIRDMISRFNGNIELVAQAAVKQTKYVAGTTLEKLAQVELGDSNRWGEIVEVNGLKAPFVTDDLSSPLLGVLKPGDTFLIPVAPKSGFSQAPPTKEIRTTKDLSELEKSLGSDLKLTADGDLSISNAGDIEVVSGAQNMAQAVVTKLSYKKGEVMRYPDLGANIVPGSKFPPIEAIRDGITNTLMQDARVDNVEQLELRRDGSALYVAFNLKIKSIDIPVPVKIKVG